MSYEDFKAGWSAAYDYSDHEWGPEPPKTPEAAWRKFKGLPEPPPEYACPACGDLPMVKRTNRREGTTFYGCRTFPVCRGTRDDHGEYPRTGTRSPQYDWTYADGDEPDDNYDPGLDGWYDQEF